jgi:GNAT superfamily N-acetyltransferase
VALPVVAPPLHDTSPEGLRAALEADMVATRLLGTEIEVDARLDSDASWSVSTPDDPLRSQVVSARFRPEEADRRIAEIVAAYDAVPTAHMWWVAPFHTPADLGVHLEAAQVYPVGEAPAMALDLRALVEPPAPAGLEIRPVTDRHGVLDYLTVLRADPMVPGVPPLYSDESVPLVLDRAEAEMAAAPTPTRYVGWLDGRPVATVRLSLAGGAAGIYNVDTLPDARGRGIGAAITAAPLLAARALGYRIGTLQSSGLGFGVYRRLGFTEQFRYALYVHVPGGARFGSG